jgi:hypothetical protein
MQDQPHTGDQHAPPCHKLPSVAYTDLLDLECSQVAGLTRTKTEFLLAQHKALIGFIVMDINDGARHYIDAGAVRRLSCAEAYAFMKPESNPKLTLDAPSASVRSEEKP